MIKYLLLLTLLICSSPCFAQTKADTVYLSVDTSSKEKCKVAVEGEGYQMLNKYRKENLQNYILYNICGEEFTFMKQRSVSDTLSFCEQKKINYSDIDYLIQKFKSTEPTKYKHNIFDKIYIVEKVSDDTFIKYEVGWIDESIWVK